MKFSILTVAMILVLGFGAQALAIDEPENVIKYRQSVLKAIGGHTGAIVAVVKGEVSYVGDVAAHARAIHEMSKLLPGLFPEGTGQDNYPETKTVCGPAITTRSRLNSATDHRLVYCIVLTLFAYPLRVRIGRSRCLIEKSAYAA